MLNGLYRLASRIATWPAISLLFIGFILCTLAFNGRSAELGNDPPLLDARYSPYGPADVQFLFDRLGQAGRNLYAVSEVTVDLAFPFIYGAILLILIYRLFEPKAARVLLLLPLAGMACDLCENASVATMAWTYMGNPPGFASIATVFTLGKNYLVILALVAVLVGAIRALILRRTVESPDSVRLG